ncbi:sulfatase-like hydrolase/transferase [Candidatus Pelagibacter sp.]|uniref:sulfatase-like hydrolase/transferase n=1 Tax=Candidatus Pelagibacter sp. TaxID=2024849 RepID=UPI003F8571B0
MNLTKKDIVSLLILFLSFFIITLTFWITKTFGKNVYYVEILYNIHIGYEGFKNSPNKYKIEFALYTFLPAIILAFIALLFNKKLNILLKINEEQKNLWINKYKNFIKKIFFNKFLKISLFNSYILLFYCSLFFVLQFGFFEYFEKSARYEDYPNLYKNPYTIKYNEPKKKKNLILFYVESLEYNISKLSNNNKSDPLKPFNEIKGKNVYDFKHAPSTNFSIAGVVASQCSVPFVVVVNTNMEKLPKEKLYCLSDVLAKQNYEQVFYISVDQQFQSFGPFKERHGFKVNDANVIKKDFRTIEKPSNKMAWGGGVYDSTLLNHAKKEIIKTYNSGKNFNFTIINTDTHHPFGYSPECIIGDISSESLQAYEAYKCSGTLIKKFFDDLDSLGILDETLVVILGDHLAFRDLIGSLSKEDERNIYFKTNSNKKINRDKINHFDIAPTILDGLGILPKNNKQFGFGVSLFEDKKNFDYDQHYNLVMRPDILSNFYMRRLLKFVPPARTDGQDPGPNATMILTID